MSAQEPAGKDLALSTLALAKLAEIPQSALQEMLAKSRWACDSHWMMAFVIAAGWEAANQANLQVTRAVGKAEMHRLMKLLGMEGVPSDEEFMLLVRIAMECFTTSDYWEYQTLITDLGEMKALVTRCYAYTKVASIGVEKDYQCGCFGLRAGWYDAMGIDVDETLVACLKDGDPHCEIVVHRGARCPEMPGVKGLEVRRRRT